jgi:hypothetical protein
LPGANGGGRGAINAGGALTQGTAGTANTGGGAGGSTGTSSGSSGGSGICIIRYWS